MFKCLNVSCGCFGSGLFARFLASWVLRNLKVLRSIFPSADHWPLAMAGKNAKKVVQPAAEPPAAVTPAAEPHAAPNFKVWRDLVSEQNFFVSVSFSIPHRNIHTSALSVAIVAEV